MLKVMALQYHVFVHWVLVEQVVLTLVRAVFVIELNWNCTHNCARKIVVIAVK